MDRSRSVRTHNYVLMKRALKTFIDKFNVTPDTTHVSMIFYAKEAKLLFNLTDEQFQSNRAIKNKINSLSDRLYGGTRTDLALMKAHDHMFQRVHDRLRRPNVLLVFTNGNAAAESAPYSETVPPLEVFIFFFSFLFFSLVLSLFPSFFFLFIFFFYFLFFLSLFLSFFFVLSLFLSFSVFFLLLLLLLIFKLQSTWESLRIFDLVAHSISVCLHIVYSLLIHLD